MFAKLCELFLMLCNTAWLIDVYMSNWLHGNFKPTTDHGIGIYTSLICQFSAYYTIMHITWPYVYSLQPSILHNASLCRILAPLDFLVIPLTHNSLSSTN